MTELQLALSMRALQSIAEGNELVLELPDEDLRVFISCDDATVTAFRDHINKALLAMLPAPPGLN